MTTEAAIQKDVETVVPGNAERNSRLAEIAEAARKERDDEIRANGGEVVNTMNIEPEAENTAPVQDPIAEKVAEPEEKPSSVDKFVTVKVDGVERQVPESMVIEAGIRSVQKESAADRRLEEAAQRRREAEQLYEQAQQFAQQVKQRPSNTDDADLAARLNVDAATIQAIREIAGHQQAIPEDTIRAEINQRVQSALNEVQAKEALKKATKEYDDVFSNPHLVQIAIAEDAKLVAEDPYMSYAERFTAVGERVREVVRELKGGKVEVATSASKAERKATITNLPSASVRQQAPEQPKAKTPADIIEEMRKRRGQAA